LAREHGVEEGVAEVCRHSRCICDTTPCAYPWAITAHFCLLITMFGRGVGSRVDWV
jgi:hypothetical protein